MPPFVIGLIVIVVLLALVWLVFRDSLRTHYHKCPQCKYVWRHRTAWAMWQEDAHTCAKCGTEQYDGYFVCRRWW